MSRQDFDFWEAIDTPLRVYRNPCTCGGKYGPCPPNCGSTFEWEYQRIRCIARSGDGSKCDAGASSAFPFCDRYHAKYAVRAFIDYLAHDAAEWGGLVGRAKSDMVRVFARIWVERYHEREISEKERRALRGLFALGSSEDSERTKAPVAQKACSLYRHFDDEGLLLYVGISVDPDKRAHEHEKGSPWWRFVATSDLEWFDSSEEAADSERRAIKTEGPIFNKAGANSERDARAVSYLIERGAHDLLRAAA